MAKKMALVDFRKCHPEQCNNGICKAAKACPRKLMSQETTYDIPMTDPALCKGCADCVRECPLKAIKIVTM